jgi:demethylmenaquinone methyltransferase / 2-methoxy-6-polyprenyl-1,4-benzoquinol methylase
MPDASPAARSVALPPHPELSSYYRGDAGKGAFLREIFDTTADEYDRVENVLALGSGRWYRRTALKRAGLSNGMKVLDVAMGTGLVAREAMTLVGPTGRVIGVDPSPGMLGQARAALGGGANGATAVVGVGQSIPFADESFDFVSMGYALRHLPDLRTAFAEFHRVLKPGGKACVLEISRPSGRVGRAAMGMYFRAVLPALGRVMRTKARTRYLWTYYWETIDQCVPPDVVLTALREAGFAKAERNVSLGMFSEFVATKG